MFVRFKTDVRRQMQRRELTSADVAYVRLSRKHFVTYDHFESMGRPPVMWTRFHEDMFGSWYLPEEFSVVMRDMTFLKYVDTREDKRCSGWVLFDDVAVCPVEDYADTEAQADEKKA